MCAGARKHRADHPALSLLAEVPVHGLVGVWLLLLEVWVVVEHDHVSTLQHDHERGVLHCQGNINVPVPMVYGFKFWVFIYVYESM